jgi:hypothetical protein
VDKRRDGKSCKIRAIDCNVEKLRWLESLAGMSWRMYYLAEYLQAVERSPMSRFGSTTCDEMVFMQIRIKCCHN